MNRFHSLAVRNWQRAGLTPVSTARRRVAPSLVTDDAAADDVWRFAAFPAPLRCGRGYPLCCAARGATGRESK